MIGEGLFHDFQFSAKNMRFDLGENRRKRKETWNVQLNVEMNPIVRPVGRCVRRVGIGGSKFV